MLSPSGATYESGAPVPKSL